MVGLIYYHGNEINSKQIVSTLTLADGLQKYLQEHGRPEDIDGFSPEQRFFISWATIWRMKTRDEALRTQIQTDPIPSPIQRQWSFGEH